MKVNWNKDFSFWLIWVGVGPNIDIVVGSSEGITREGFYRSPLLNIYEQNIYFWSTVIYPPGTISRDPQGDQLILL